MRNHSHDRHRQHVSGLILLIAAVVILAAVLFLLNRTEEENAATAPDLPRATAQPEDSPREDIGLAERVVWNGRAYQMRPNLERVLLIGYDKEGETEYGNREGGQSDFLVLAVIDDGAEAVSLLQIDRDSMVRLKTYDSFGRPAGSKVMQISLSHLWTGNVDTNDANTREAVQNLLGIRVDETVSIDFSGIAALNRLVGGVKVTLREDMTAIDPAFEAGATVTLDDRLVVPFVRARRGVGDGLNSSRMARHRDYMNAFIDQAEALAREDSGYVSTLVNGLYDVANFSHASSAKGWMLNRLNKILGARHYTIGRPAPLEFSWDISERTGFREVHVDDDAIVAWVLETLYKPAK